MACLKCGKKTADEQVFCPACLAVMEAYPVKPILHIQLPNRKERPLPKRSGRKRLALTMEEQLSLLKKRQSRLIAIIVLLVLLLGAIVYQHFFLEAVLEESGRDHQFSTQLPTE